MDSLICLSLLLVACPLAALAGEAKFSPPTPDGAVSYGQPPAYPGNIWSEEHPGFAVQTGYEGYLVPAESLSIKDIIKTAGFLSALPVLGKVALKLVVKVGVAILALGVTVAVGVVLTYLLCTFTSVCSLTLHKFGKWHKWDRESVRGLISDDHLNRAAEFLSSAIAKYKDAGEAPIQTKTATD